MVLAGANVGDAIVAWSSAPGRSARAIVRMSGRDRAAVLSRVRGVGASRGAYRARVVLEGATLPALALWFPGPRSYTGEDVLELVIPGSPALVGRVIDALVSGGARPAEPGEFSARAYLNGRMTLEEAEGVAAMIAAATGAQLEASRRLVEGETGSAYRAMAEECTTLLALVEAGIDFTDQEDVTAIEAAELSRRARALAERIGGMLGASRGVEARETLPRVALAGRPNAGKSTLFNALVGRRRSVASVEAGTTRDVIEEEVDLSRWWPGAGRVVVQDAAGVDAQVGSRSEADALAMSRAREAASGADVVAWCDPTGRFEGEPPGRRVVRVRTFADRAHGASAWGVVDVCALDGWNLGAFAHAVDEAVGTSVAGSIASLLPRHRVALLRARACLAQVAGLAAGAAGRLAEPEVAAEELRGALEALGELAGRITPDEVLGRVFASFCVGK